MGKLVYNGMIIMQLMGGLGNQMFQYALGRRLAIERNVSLKLDLSWYKQYDTRTYRLDYFQIDAEIASPDELEGVKYSRWRGIPARFQQSIQNYLPYYRQAVVHEKSLSFDPNILKVPRHAYLNGYWQSEKYFKSIEIIIRNEFQPKYPLSPISLEWARVIRDNPSVSLHIRRGDYVSDPHINQVHGVCSLKYYQKAAEHILLSKPDAIFFIFSDDLGWARLNIDFLGMANFVQVEGDARDTEELHLMSLCQHHIIANSSFSWWAGWLGSNPQKIVIAPQRWFNDQSRDITHLFPDSWMLIL
jgi:hypothetical protein